jgi:hypothetical protein
LILRLRTLLPTSNAGQAAFVAVALSDLDNCVSSDIRDFRLADTWSATLFVVPIGVKTVRVVRD